MKYKIGQVAFLVSLICLFSQTGCNVNMIPMDKEEVIERQHVVVKVEVIERQKVVVKEEVIEHQKVVVKEEVIE